MMMMRSQIVPVVTFVIVALAIETCQAGYGRINDYLIKQVKGNDDIGPNMEAASKWLKESGGKKGLFNRVPVSDLKTFVTLQQVIDDNKCGKEAYEIMRANEEADGASLATENGGNRRVDKVIKKIFKNHGEKCDKVYPSRLRELKEQLDTKQVEKVVNLAKKIVYCDKWIHRMPEEGLPYYYIRTSLSINHYIGEVSFKAVVAANGADDPDLKYLERTHDEHSGKTVINKTKINELAQRYLFEPCRYFTNFLGPNLFTPARYNQRFIDHEADLKNPDYYLTWSRFRLCEMVIEKEDAVMNDLYRSVAKGSAK